jgi:hypothetical protein
MEEIAPGSHSLFPLGSQCAKVRRRRRRLRFSLALVPHSPYPYPITPTMGSLSPLPKNAFENPLGKYLASPKNKLKAPNSSSSSSRTYAHTHAHMCYIPISSTAQKKEGSKEQNSPTEKHKHISYFQYTASSGRKFLVYPEATLSRGISALSIGPGHFETPNAPLRRVFSFKTFFLVIPSGYPLGIFIFILNKFLLVFYVRKKTP